jgi:hypothetical protein
MNVVPIGNCLRDHSTAATAGGAEFSDSRREIADRVVACRLASEEGYANGQRDARTELAGDYDRRLAAEVANMKERADTDAAAAHDELLSRWASDTTTCLHLALERLEQQIATQVLDALQPVIGDAAEKWAVSEIARRCCRLGQKGEARMSVSGPRHLVESLVRALPGVSFDVSDAQTLELNVWIGETELSTQLSDWRRKYMEARP